MRNRKMLYPVLQQAVRDGWFQTCWKAAAVAEERFADVRENLSEEQQEILEQYLAAREELALAMVAVAYKL